MTKQKQVEALQVSSVKHGNHNQLVWSIDVKPKYHNFNTDKIQEVKDLQELKSTFRFGGEWRGFLFIFHCFGNSPLFYDKMSGMYQLNYVSWQTLAVFLWGSMSVIAWVFYLLDFFNFISVPVLSDRSLIEDMERILGDQNRTNPVVSRLVLNSFKSMCFFYPVSQIVDIVCEWIQSPHLLAILNNWDEFHHLFFQSFPLTFQKFQRIFQDKSVKPRMVKIPYLARKIRMRSCRAVFFNLVVSTVALVTTVGWKAGKGDVLEIIFLIFFSLRLITLVLVDDIKNIFLYDDIAHAFFIIRMGIHAASKRDESKSGTETESGGGTVKEEDVKSWRKLIHLVRSQCDLVGNYQKPAQLFFIFRSIVTSTAFIFILFNLPWENETDSPFGFAQGWSFFYLVQIMRMYAKCHKAQAITVQESLIASELAKISIGQVGTENQTTAIQIQLTHDMISLNPSKISFGNYVTLDKKLLLTFFQQIVAYLIVMMQLIPNK